MEVETEKASAAPHWAEDRVAALGKVLSCPAPRAKAMVLLLLSGRENAMDAVFWTGLWMCIPTPRTVLSRSFRIDCFSQDRAHLQLQQQSEMAKTESVGKRRP